MSPAAKAKADDTRSTLDTHRYSEPTYSMEWDDGQGIVAIYSDGLSEDQVNEFCDALIRRLQRKPN